LNLVEEINLPLSAAIGASARFPVMSELGWLRQPKSPGCENQEAVTDGGFYDNYGAATILDLLDGLARNGADAVDLAQNVSLVVVQITSDPSREMGCLFKNLDADGRSDDNVKAAGDFCYPPLPATSPPPPPQGSAVQLEINKLSETLRKQV